MQAILTKYYGPTDSRGSRILAKCERGKLTMPYRHEFNIEDNHAAAAKMLCERFIKEDVEKYGADSARSSFWARPFVSGCIVGGGWAHVFVY